MIDDLESVLDLRPLKISISSDSKWVAAYLGDDLISYMTMGEWSKVIANPGKLPDVTLTPPDKGDAA
jgi:hypothetical protein